MDSLDTKGVVDGLRAATAIAKGARGLINEVIPIVKNIPWRTVLRWVGWFLKKVVELLKETVRFPYSPRRTILVVKFSAAVASYVLTFVCLALFLSDVVVICDLRFSPLTRLGVAAFAAFTCWAFIASFAQASWLTALLAQNSRVLWGQRSTINF